MKNEDRVRFLHMREATAEAIAMAAGPSREQLLTDRMFSLALAPCLEIIGEAASRLTAETRAEHPTLPYVEMITMRNRLIHAYRAFSRQHTGSSRRAGPMRRIASVFSARQA